MVRWIRIEIPTPVGPFWSQRLEQTIAWWDWCWRSQVKAFDGILGNDGGELCLPCALAFVATSGGHSHPWGLVWWLVERCCVPEAKVAARRRSCPHGWAFLGWGYWCRHASYSVFSPWRGGSGTRFSPVSRRAREFELTRPFGGWWCIDCSGTLSLVPDAGGRYKLLCICP